MAVINPEVHIYVDVHFGPIQPKEDEATKTSLRDLRITHWLRRPGIAIRPTLRDFSRDLGFLLHLPIPLRSRGLLVRLVWLCIALSRRRTRRSVLLVRRLAMSRWTEQLLRREPRTCFNHDNEYTSDSGYPKELGIATREHTSSCYIVIQIHQ
jgi:hypothetical protein